MPAVVVVAVVPVARGDDDGVVVGVRIEVPRDAFGDRVAADDAQGAAFGEIVLDVDDEQCPAHAPSLRAAGAAGAVIRG